jgi:hypothetical protein
MALIDPSPGAISHSAARRRFLKISSIDHRFFTDEGSMSATRHSNWDHKANLASGSALYQLQVQVVEVLWRCNRTAADGLGSRLLDQARPS